MTISETSLFDRHEAARRLALSIPTLDRLVKNGRIPHFRVGRRVLFSQELLDDFLADSLCGSDRIRRSQKLIVVHNG